MCVCVCFCRPRATQRKDVLSLAPSLPPSLLALSSGGRARAANPHDLGAVQADGAVPYS